MKSFDVSDLLTIDVGSEVKKLAEATLDGPWQAPAELVRRALGVGARTIEVEMGRHRLVVRDDGRGLDGEPLRHLASLLDEEKSAADRHRSLRALEAAGEGGLILLVALRPGGLVVEARAGDGTRRLVWFRGRRAGGGGRARLETSGGQMGRPSAPRRPGSQGTIFELSGLALDPRRSRRWLHAVCRFAPGVIAVDGRVVPRGFDAPLAEAVLEPPLAGRIAIPRQGEVARLWLLHEGVVSAFLSLPETPAFEAFAEMRGFAAGSGGAACREAIAPHLDALVDQGVRLALALAATLPDRDETTQRQVRSVLLDAARSGRRRGEILRTPAFPALLGPAGREERWLSFLDLGEASRAGGAEGAGAEGPSLRVCALEPNQAPSGFILPHAPILVLGAVERSRVARLLGVRFEPPPRRPSRASVGAWWREALTAARRALASALRRIFGLAGKPLSAATLSPSERALVAALRTSLRAGRMADAVAFCTGRGPIARLGQGRLLLPRDDATVRAAVRAVALDPAWAYPAGLALLEERWVELARGAEDDQRRWRENGPFSPTG